MDLDAGSLAAFDTTAVPINAATPALSIDKILLEKTTGALQQLFDVVFALPVTATDNNGVLASLPTPTSKLPRALPVPTSDQLTTRWEKFAKEKGIKKTKKTRRVFDEESGKLKVRYGYDEKRDKDEVPADWLIEVKNSKTRKPVDSEPDTDAYTARAAEKRERVAKNKSQQRRNQLENPKSGLTPKEARKAHLKAQLKDARTSTASIGRFDKTVKGEDQIKFKKGKRKFDDVTGSAEGERDKVRKIVGGVNKKVNADGGIIATKAVSQIAQSSKKPSFKKSPPKNKKK
ncbi:ribosome biogenesis regulatory protein-domain-containing protein [Obelidium mucronatum]|nr:ribosome biogenesis regulatory protein-domain-containing protein [Obelidium mucronatum]